MTMQHPIPHLTTDFAKTVGTIRPLHGVNLGPLTSWGGIDLTPNYRDTRIPAVRMHDCPYRMMDVCDIHLVFPNFDADPDDPAQYRFTQTDDYIQAIRNIDAEVIYRLGESIEHYQHKSHVHPPADYDKWARICVNIIRHYNDGWANGFHHGIRYWEIWNEPEVRPQCWTGSDEEFIALYITAAKAIKAYNPNLMVGGPAFAGIWQWMHEFREAFLQACIAEQAPIDFFSWHSYADTPKRLYDGIHEARRLLDAHGFTASENHLNEWNYLPGEDWLSLRGPDFDLRTRIRDRQHGVEGAAFIASALCYFQDAPLDMGNFYTGDILGWGLFRQTGVPQPNYYAFKAFSALLDTPVRARTSGEDLEQGLAICAGRAPDNTQAAVLVSNFRSSASVFDLAVTGLPWHGRTRCEKYLLDETHHLELSTIEYLHGTDVTLRETLPAPAVCLLKFSPES